MPSISTLHICVKLIFITFFSFTYRDKRLNDAPKLFSVYTRKNDKKASDLIEWAHSQL